ncbi:hypothetical protein [Aquimarina algiphila]|uniref:hypothetical protein n=1 Tax=Aquimarina algiphila TaxID=2047982 RepID=UPI0024922339|nr:hypothetical protein [Aquimarina algiphila]
MKKIIFLLLIMVVVISCEKESTESFEESVEQDIDIESPSEILSKSTVYATDASGRVEIVYSDNTIVNSNLVSNPNLLTGNTFVPDGYVCIGGSVRMSYNASDAGSLLTMSAPMLGANAFKGWQVQAKTHITPNAFAWFIRIGTIGIRLKDNNGNYIPADVLKQSLRIFSNTSSLSSRPSTSVSVPSGYTLISGGAKDNWTGFGNLLTDSYPSGNSWIARGKDHINGSPSTVTAYAIGIKNVIPNFGSLSFTSGSACNNISSGVGGASVSLPSGNGFVISGSGANSSYNGFGRMLTDITVSSTGVSSKSKDHLRADSGRSCSYYIAVKKQ